MTYRGPDGPESEQEPLEPAAVEYTEPSVPIDPPKAPPPRESKAWTIALGILGGALLGTGVTLGVLTAAGVLEEPAPPTQPTNPPPPTLTIPAPRDTTQVAVNPGVIADIAGRALPSIVTIESSGFLTDSGGSGVVYGTDGHVITNHHVIEGADDVVVVFSDGARYPATIIGSDPLTDIAVLHTERPDLIPIALGRSEDIRIGGMAVAVGSPLGLAGGPSVTSGIVSAIGRSLDVDGGPPLNGLIQTDAPITRGSSGGALLDQDARLIGITTAIAVSDVGAEGLGFAIPVELAVSVANDLIVDGEVAHALLGVSGNTAFAEEGGATYPVGILVDELLDDSAYEVAGGRVNDVITSLDGLPLTTMDELLARLRLLRADDVVVFGVLRSESRLDLTVTLGRLAP